MDDETYNKTCDACDKIQVELLNVLNELEESGEVEKLICKIEDCTDAGKLISYSTDVFTMFFKQQMDE